MKSLKIQFAYRIIFSVSFKFSKSKLLISFWIFKIEAYARLVVWSILIKKIVK